MERNLNEINVVVCVSVSFKHSFYNVVKQNEDQDGKTTVETFDVLHSLSSSLQKKENTVPEVVRIWSRTKEIVRLVKIIKRISHHLTFEVLQSSV